MLPLHSASYCEGAVAPPPPPISDQPPVSTTSATASRPLAAVGGAIHACWESGTFLDGHRCSYILSGSGGRAGPGGGRGNPLPGYCRVRDSGVPGRDTNLCARGDCGGRTPRYGGRVSRGFTLRPAEAGVGGRTRWRLWREPGGRALGRALSHQRRRPSPPSQLSPPRARART